MAFLTWIRSLFGRLAPAQRSAAPKHAFRIGQPVRLVPGHSFRGVVSGRYRVTAILPSDGKAAAYRIKSAEELFERTVQSHEISADHGP